MAEGYVNLFAQKDTANNKPHFRGYFKIKEGDREVEHEFALWPAKEGKKGFSGKYKPKGEKRPAAEQPAGDDEINF